MTADFTGATWRKGLRSNDTACVEFAVVAEAAAVRDSKHPEGGHIVVTRSEWSRLLGAIKVGDLDL